MTQVEQLRKEVNELRERVAKLEARPVQFALPTQLPLPQVPQFYPPYTITCGEAK